MSDRASIFTDNAYMDEILSLNIYKAFRGPPPRPKVFGTLLLGYMATLLEETTHAKFI